MIFVDADFFIGLYHKKDHHHKRCLQLLEKIKGELLTSYDVIDEVITKLSYFLTQKIALVFIHDILSQEIVVVYPNRALFLKAKTIFEKQKSKHVSMTDCMNMAIAKDKRIKMFLSFDKIYEQNKFELVK